MDIEQLLLESVQLLGLGMGAVFIILILLIGLISIVSRIVPEEPRPVSAPPPADNKNHIAAISAAVKQYRKKHR